MPDMYTMFRLMVAVCFACVVMSLFLYLSLQPYYSGEIGGPGPAVASKEAPSSKGLYFNSKSVDELNPYTYSIISEGKNPSIILYYASWCGHCRHFVPMYNTLASETNARVLDINKEKQSRKGWRKRATHRTYSPLRFTAIDCAEYSTICAKAGISSYPTLKTYNIGGASDEVVGATVKKVSKIINEKFFGIKAGATNNGTNDSAESKNDNTLMAITRKPDSLSYAASPVQRWQDATASLNFLLLSELPATWTEVQKASLDCFLKMLVTLYPTGPEQSSAKGVYEAVIRVLEEDTAAPHKFLSDKIVNKVRAAYPAPLKWRVCGVTMTGPASAEGSSTTHILSTSTSSHDVSLSVRSVGSSDEPRGGSGYLRTVVGGSRSSNGKEGSGTDGVSSRSGADDGESASKNAQIGEISAAALGAGASGGYTCGLWFLFHYIAAASGRTSTNSQHVTAVAVKENIFALVRDFFGCYDCREHFMTAYEKCDFGVCNIQDSDYDKLQLWLFHQHNSVTRRVSLEDTPRSDSSSEGGGSIADADHEISALENLWPSAQLCSSCISVSTDKPSPAALLNSYDPSLYNEQNVLDFLQNAYIPPAK